jgi:hypothetical protein
MGPGFMVNLYKSSRSTAVKEFAVRCRAIVGMVNTFVVCSVCSQNPVGYQLRHSQSRKKGNAEEQIYFAILQHLESDRSPSTNDSH